MSDEVHLVIPDQHAHPDHNNDRFTWLGEFIKDLKPTKIINIGDGADMESLCSYDFNKSDFHTRRYKADVDSWLDAQERIWAPIKKAKKRKPASYYCVGNHENRINRAIDNNKVMLDGIISMSDLELERNWDHVSPFNTPVVLDGVHYNHYFTSGVMGRPIGGENAAANLIRKQLVSCTVGHSHVLDYAVRADASGTHKMGLVAGVFQDYEADFAGPSNKLWWRGLCVKRNVANGQYDLETVSMEQLRKAYA